jgi:hypothetical protein
MPLHRPAREYTKPGLRFCRMPGSVHLRKARISFFPNVRIDFLFVKCPDMSIYDQAVHRDRHLEFEVVPKKIASTPSRPPRQAPKCEVVLHSKIVDKCQLPFLCQSNQTTCRLQDSPETGIHLTPRDIIQASQGIHKARISFLPNVRICPFTKRPNFLFAECPDRFPFCAMSRPVHLRPSGPPRQALKFEVVPE